MRSHSLAAAASLALVAACYDPQLSDCTTRCASNDDCGPSQACTSQGYCAAPDRACAAGSSGAPIDASIDAPTDAMKKPDARPMRLVQLHVRVTMGGKVRVDAATCDGDSTNGGNPQPGDCHIPVSEGESVTLRATSRGGYSFERWTTLACAGASPICVLTPFGPMIEVAAQFTPER